MEIRSLEHIGFDTLFRGFENAFSDYEIHFDKEEVRSMLSRRGYDPRLSFAAFDEGRIVAFTLNGIGHFNGVKTAYDTGTGTAKDYRGQGLAVEIFNYSLPLLKEAGVRQYLLEVLQGNHKAINVYRRLQFVTKREFDCFRQSIAEISSLDTSMRYADIRVEIVDTDIIRAAGAFCDFYPSWQNSIESIERGRGGLTCISAFHSDRLVGYCVSDSATGDLTQLAVNREYRRGGIATRLLRETMARMSTDFIKVLNIPSDDTSLHRFLADKNINLKNRQFEMVLPF